MYQQIFVLIRTKRRIQLNEVPEKKPGTEGPLQVLTSTESPTNCHRFEISSNFF